MDIAERMRAWIKTASCFGLDTIGKDCKAAAEEITALRAELEKCRKDAELMNYVCSVTRCDPKMDGNHVFWGLGGRPLKGGNLRQAIENEMIRMYGKPEMPKEPDAAMEQERGK